MGTRSHGARTATDRLVGKSRSWTLRLSVGAWMTTLVTVALAGYAVFGLQYLANERGHRERLSTNSAHIEIERYLVAARASYDIAWSAVTNAAVLPTETVWAAASAFVGNMQAAKAVNHVPALDDHLNDMAAAMAKVEQALAGEKIDTAKLREALAEAGTILNIVSMIAEEGRRAEWQQLLAGSKSNFDGLIALLATCLIVVGALGYLIALSLRRVFGDVIRIHGELAGGRLECDIPDVDGRTEAGRIYAALRVFRDNAAARARLEASARASETARATRQQRVEALIDDFRGRVQQVLAAVASNMNQMQTTAHRLSRAAEETSGRATGAAKASEETSANVRNVAAAAEELASSISEIFRQVSDASEVVTGATEDARATNVSVASLACAAQKIGEVVDLIRDIAEQTNLLALNATIEAARAGDAGRGFAVVAAEVKTLATQTAHATGDIGSHIAAIQTSTAQSVGAMQNLAAKMEEVNSYAATIAVSVERQGAATTEISRNVQDAARETQTFATHMTALTSAVSETLISAAMAESEAASVVGHAAQLREAINTFLGEVAAA